MRDIDVIINEICGWDGTFEELANHLTNEDYEELSYNATFDYTDDDYLSDLYEDKNYKGILKEFIKDCLMYSVNNHYTGKTANNLFRLWNEMN